MGRLLYRLGVNSPGPAPQSLLGAKGARLHELTRAGFPVPPGFTISAPACDQIRAAGGTVSPALVAQLRTAVRWLERAWRSASGSPRGPVRFAVRCSPQVPLLGLKPTLLNVGADTTHPGEARGHNGLEHLARAISTAASSWDSPVARVYREKNQGIPGTLAVVVMAMVPRDVEGASGDGSASTRDPITGETVLAGECRVYDDSRNGNDPQRLPLHLLRERHPAVWKRVAALGSKLESHHADAISMQFCFGFNRLFLLEARPMDRTARAAVRIAVDMARSKVIDRKTAVRRIAPQDLEGLLRPTFDRTAPLEVLTSGFGASPGAATGRIAFSAEEAARRAMAGEKVILVRHETDAADVSGMRVCQAILTRTGAMTSHAAIVARGMGIPCVSGAEALRIDARAREMHVNGRRLGERDWLSLDGGSGEVMLGRAPIIHGEMTGPLKTLLGWADQYRKLEVRANADTPHDAEIARALGAQGIGLTRTEHMFFDPQRIRHMRQMILANDAEAREAALARLLPYQREDFAGIFRSMSGLPVTIRLLDPPLHEFLPHTEKDQAELARSLGLSTEQVTHRVRQLQEVNPMLGHRGDRLAVTYPEILQMQVRAILEAACDVKQEGVKVRPEIMIPLAGTKAELDYLKTFTDQTARAVMTEKRAKVEYLYGTMIEVPRAAVTADELAQTAQFFSFGTNDLTQLTFGYSRDDASSFLPDFLGKKILDRDPFQTLDTTGVGKLIRMAVELGRRTRPTLKCGICGEHGGDTKSVIFCHQVGLNYVSCSPFRVPIARLAAAHAALLDELPTRSKKK